MNPMKPYLSIFLIALSGSLLLLSIFFRFGKHSRSVAKGELAESVNGNIVQSGSSLSLKSALNAMVDDSRAKKTRKSYGGVKADNAALAKREYSNQQVHASDLYFSKLIQTRQTAELYRRVKSILGPTPSAEGASKWITLGGIFESTPIYGDTLMRSLQEANRNPKEVVDSISKEIQQVRKDPFIYQMTMNLVYQLSLPAEDQTKFYGQEIEQQLKELAPQAKPSDSFRVAELGLMLAKQAGVPGGEMEPYIKRGLSQSKGSANILNEFRENVSFYFPEVKL